MKRAFKGLSCDFKFFIAVQNLLSESSFELLVSVIAADILFIFHVARFLLHNKSLYLISLSLHHLVSSLACETYMALYSNPK